MADSLPEIASKVKLYQLPIYEKVILPGGVDVNADVGEQISDGKEIAAAPPPQLAIDQSNAPVFFEYAGQIYIAQKENNVIPSDPEKWGVVLPGSKMGGILTGGTQDNAFYYNQNYNAYALEELQDFGSKLNGKIRRNELQPLEDTDFSVATMSEIVRGKEKIGSGHNDWLIPYLDEHKDLEFFTSLNMSEGIDAIDSYYDEKKPREALERIALHAQTRTPFYTERNDVWDFLQAKPYYVFESLALNEVSEQLPQEIEVNGKQYRTPPINGRLQRIDITYKEVLLEDGTTTIEPSLAKQEVALADLLGSFATRNLQHAPRSLSTAIIEQDNQALGEYLKRDAASIEQFAKSSEKNDYKSTVSVLPQQAIDSADAKTLNWYRVKRDSDYPGGELAVSRSDYFIVTPHPDDKEGYQILLFNGSDDASVNPPQKIDCLGDKRDFKKDNYLRTDAAQEVRLKLQELGIKAEDQIVPVWQEEFKQFRSQRQVDQSLNVHGWEENVSNQKIVPIGENTVNWPDKKHEFIYQKDIPSFPQRGVPDPEFSIENGVGRINPEKIRLNSLYKIDDNKFAFVRKYGVALFSIENGVGKFEKVDSSYRSGANIATALADAKTCVPADSQAYTDFIRYLDENLSDKDVAYTKNALVAASFETGIPNDNIQQEYAVELAKLDAGKVASQNLAAIENGEAQISAYMSKDTPPILHFSVELAGESKTYKLVDIDWQESTDTPDPANKIDITDANFHKAFYEQALANSINFSPTYTSRFLSGVRGSDATTRSAIDKHFTDNKIGYASRIYNEPLATQGDDGDKPVDAAKPEATGAAPAANNSNPPAADDEKDNSTLHTVAFAGGLVTTALAGFSILNGKEKDRSDKEAANEGSWVKYVAGGIGVAAAAYGAYQKWGKGR